MSPGVSTLIILKRLASLSILPKLVLTFLGTLTPLYIIGWRMNEIGSNHVQKKYRPLRLPNFPVHEHARI